MTWGAGFVSKGIERAEVSRMDSPSKTLINQLRKYRKEGLSWRQIKNLHYKDLPVSHTTLSRIVRGYIPTNYTTRKALGLPNEVVILGFSHPGPIWISPGFEIIQCNYRYCDIEFIKRVPNQLYHVPRCGVLERRIQKRESANEDN